MSLVPAGTVTSEVHAPNRDEVDSGIGVAVPVAQARATGMFRGIARRPIGVLNLRDRRTSSRHTTTTRRSNHVH